MRLRDALDPPPDSTATDILVAIGIGVALGLVALIAEMARGEP